MTKPARKPAEKQEDVMRPEYDFRGGVRGKHHQAYRQGHTVKIRQSNGTTVVQHFKLEEGAVVLDPDVSEYFPTSEAVNNALRSLIALVPKKREATSRR
jgi:hypothetical protein